MHSMCITPKPWCKAISKMAHKVCLETEISLVQDKNLALRTFVPADLEVLVPKFSHRALAFFFLEVQNVC